MPTRLVKVCELKANPKRYALGTVIESKLDKNVGSQVTLLIQNVFCQQPIKYKQIQFYPQKKQQVEVLKQKYITAPQKYILIIFFIFDTSFSVLLLYAKYPDTIKNTGTAKRAKASTISPAKPLNLKWIKTTAYDAISFKTSNDIFLLFSFETPISIIFFS